MPVLGDPRTMKVVIWRIVVAALFLGVWELVGRFGDGTWIGSPSLIALRLVTLIAGPLWVNLGISLAEMGLGLALGVPAGAVTGLALGCMPRAARLLRPLILALYSVPLVTLAPVLILWFGLEMRPKIFLVAVVSFFLLFFNIFSAVLAIDRDLVHALQLMGASRFEVLRKLIAPACVPWFFTGVKI